jgi:ferric-dicitrate binding protein FerR (iron transport regulator)
MLSDSSILYVNAGTSVTYPAVFKGDKREIYVTGEIYAEVRRDEKKPFIVKTDHMDIQVLGTSFDVSAYREDRQERVVLVSGTVEVGMQGNRLHLNPNQAYTLMEQEGTLETVDVELYTSWRDGIYVFKDESIEHILLRLARYYNVTLILPEQFSGVVCSGKLELKEELSILLNGLSQIASFNFAVKDSEYRILFH